MEARMHIRMDKGLRDAAMKAAKKMGSDLSTEIRKFCTTLAYENVTAIVTPKAPAKVRPVVQASDEGVRLATLLFETVVLAGDANAKQPNLQSWALEVDRLIRIDGRDPAEVEALILWISKDSFERTVVLSTGKLRKRYSQLLIKAKAAVQKNTIKSL